jgi:hypothetical protein
MSGDAVGGDGGVNVNKSVVLHDPVCSVSFRLDWVVADFFEDIIRDFEADVRPCPTGRVGEAGPAQP